MTVYAAAQAATVCQVSLRTVQRRMPQLEKAGAWKDAAGQWCIPVEAMRAAGLSPGRPARPDNSGDSSLRQRDTADLVSQLSQLRAERNRVEAELAEWRRRAEIAEAQAAERERTIQAQAQALRMLEAAPTPALAPPSAQPVAQPASRLGGLFGFGRLLGF